MVSRMSLESEDGEKVYFFKEMIPAPMECYMTKQSFLLMCEGNGLHQLIHALSYLTWILSGGKKLIGNFLGVGDLITDIQFVTAT